MNAQQLTITTTDKEQFDLLVSEALNNGYEVSGNAQFACDFGNQQKVITYSRSLIKPGTGTPTIFVTPVTLRFPGTNVGEQSDLQITVSGSNLTAPISVGDPNTGEFSITDGGGDHDPDENGNVAEFTVTVSFNPDSVNNFRDWFQIASDGAQTVNVTLEGQGIEP